MSLTETVNNSPLVSAESLYQNLANPDWKIIDCRFSLADAEAGFKAYRFGHIPGAVYADLNRDLSAPATALTGRHPLPPIRRLAAVFSGWGIGGGTRAVAYDDGDGAFAARLWWLLRYLGHDRAAVLDGGIRHWRRSGLPLTTRLPPIRQVQFTPRPRENLCLTANEVETGLARKTVCLIDARAPERYHGRLEPIDPVAGHVPGAVNRPFQANVNAGGLFLPKEILFDDFKRIIGSTPPERVVHMCGSGVTACHNVLAMDYAGLEGSRLYAGSWSEWIRNPNRPVALKAAGKV